MKHKIFVAGVSLALLEALALGCSSKNNGTTGGGGTTNSASVTTPSKEAVKIAWISKGACNTFYDISRQGAKLAAQDLTITSGREVDVALMEPDDCTVADAGADAATSDAGSGTASDGGSTASDGGSADAGDGGAVCPYPKAIAQAAKIREAIDSKLSAIAITVIDPICLTPAINEAVNKGIPVITFDSDAPDSERATYYGMDNVAAAQLAGKTLAKMLNDSGKVLVQTSMNLDKTTGAYKLSTSASYVDRMNGFTTEMQNHPGITVLAPIPCTGNDVTDTFCSKQVEAALVANPDVTGIMYLRGKILREVDIATAAPTLTAAMKAGKIQAVAFDAPQDALPGIQAGYAQMIINQRQFGWGYDVVALAFDMVTINRQVKPFTDSGWDLICPNNLDQFAKNMQAQDFRTPLPKCQYIP